MRRTKEQKCTADLLHSTYRSSDQAGEYRSNPGGIKHYESYIRALSIQKNI